MPDHTVLNNISINENCVGCGQCVVFCPHNAIIVCGTATINDRCMKCEICITYCPVGAIGRDEQ